MCICCNRTQLIKAIVCFVYSFCNISLFACIFKNYHDDDGNDDDNDNTIENVTDNL